MRGRLALGSLVLLYFLQVWGAKALGAAPSSNRLVHEWINQKNLGGIPDSHAAFFRIFNQTGAEAPLRIGLGDAFSGDPVELSPGQPAIVTQGWSMSVYSDCGNQEVRPIVDFDSPQCQVDSEADPDSQLTAILSLPDGCLGPAENACQFFDGPGFLDFASSLEKSRKTLQDIELSFMLDGISLPPKVSVTKPFKYNLGSSPEESESCEDSNHYMPIYVYFFYGYQMPSETGQCIAKSVGAAVTPLSPGDHTLEFFIDLPELGELDFPPVTIHQD